MITDLIISGLNIFVNDKKFKSISKIFYVMLIAKLSYHITITKMITWCMEVITFSFGILIFAQIRSIAVKTTRVRNAFCMDLKCKIITRTWRMIILYLKWRCLNCKTITPMYRVNQKTLIYHVWACHFLLWIIVIPWSLSLLTSNARYRVVIKMWFWLYTIICIYHSKIFIHICLRIFQYFTNKSNLVTYGMVLKCHRFVFELFWYIDQILHSAPMLSINITVAMRIIGQNKKWVLDIFLLSLIILTKKHYRINKHFATGLRKSWWYPRNNYN